MIQKLPSPLPGHLRVVFELPANLWADHICVVGDFDQRDCCSHSLQQTRDGRWQTTLDLPEDRIYHYYYLIDGRRQADCYSDGSIADHTGSYVSLIDAKQKPAGTRLPALASWQLAQMQPAIALQPA